MYKIMRKWGLVAAGGLGLLMFAITSGWWSVTAISFMILKEWIRFIFTWGAIPEDPVAALQSVILWQ